jgi:hypothetical protein
MEDDLSLASAEIWVNRTLEWCEKRQLFLSVSLCLSRACLGKMIGFIYKLLKNGVFRRANQAAEMNADGLLGLTWRTWETSPQIHALSRAGWEETASTLTDNSFWHDFCSANFGSETAAACVKNFLSVDSFSTPDLHPYTPPHQPGAGNALLASHFFKLKAIFLPRQARDKHQENSPKEGVALREWRRRRLQATTQRPGVLWRADALGDRA